MSLLNFLILGCLPGVFQDLILALIPIVVRIREGKSWGDLKELEQSQHIRE